MGRLVAWFSELRVGGPRGMGQVATGARREFWVTDGRFSRQRLRLETGDWRLEASARSRSVGNASSGAASLPGSWGFGLRPPDLAFGLSDSCLGFFGLEEACWLEWADGRGAWDPFFVCGSGDGERSSLMGSIWGKGNLGGGPAGTVPGSGGGMGRCLEPSARRIWGRRDEESEKPQLGRRRGGSLPARAWWPRSS